MTIDIDKNSGFCFGVIKAVDKAEELLNAGEKLYCLGEMVHNQEEVSRLKQLGLITINHDEFKNLNNCNVLIRAHGEPPETYEIAKNNNLKLIDATCPVVLKLQQRVKESYDNLKNKEGQLVIYGKTGHAEVIGLAGQTNNEAIVISEQNELDKIDFNKPVRLFSQTTMSKNGFEEIKKSIKTKMKEIQHNNLVDFDARNTVCGQVSCREPALIEFAKNHDVIIFVSGKNSSNGKFLFDVCCRVNPGSYLISKPEDLKEKWFRDISSVGVSGATSTPVWLLQSVVEKIKELTK